MSETPIYCSRQLIAFWPTPLASQWRRLYPQLFDPDDERLARNQPRYHFKEWLAAIHLFHRDGTHALVSKYAYRNHQLKFERLESLCGSDECAFLRGLRHSHGVQPPDLLLYVPGHRQVRFAEVKGPAEPLRPLQLRSHKAIEGIFGKPVEIVRVKYVR